MTTLDGGVSVTDIREVGAAVRREYGSDLNGLCYEVNETVGERLMDRGLPTYEVPKVYVDADGDAHHYVLEVGADVVTTAEDNAQPAGHAPGGGGGDGVASPNERLERRCVAAESEREQTVVIDAALDQFSIAEWRRGRVETALGPEVCLASVLVAPPGDSRRRVYRRFEATAPGLDPGVGSR